jgi:multidrug resistance efflux pump
MRKFLTIIALTVIGVVAGFAAWFAPSLPTGIAQDSTRPNLQPLISRGYTDAPSGTVTVAGDPLGGATLIELRIKDGQTVKEGEIIGVLSEYPRADIAVRTAEASLEKLQQVRETMTKGSRVTEIGLAEDNIAQTIERNRLRVLELQRSGKPPDQKEIELSLSEQNLEKQRTNLVLQKQTLAADLAINAIDIANAKAVLDRALANRESALVRSPIDGVVVQIFTRQGERVGGYGIAKIVDMRKLRVLAEVDELHLDRLVPGARVEITFRGSPTVYTGKVVRSPMTVTRVKRSKADLGEGSAHQVEAEIEFDDPTKIPQMLERETRVVFL